MNAVVSPPVQSDMPSPFPAEWASDWGEDQYGLWMSVIINSVRQTFRWIRPGKFLMGSPGTEGDRGNDELQHAVTLTQGYWLADTTCTQALWSAIAESQPSHFSGEQRPVEQVSWDDVSSWIEQLNELIPGLNTRLPTEAEWEYACRAGSTTPYSFGATIAKGDANVGNQVGQTVAIKSLPINAWGLYEMHGNVWEWCSDWYAPYVVDDVTDPQGPEEGDLRVLRGGSWLYPAGFARSAQRVADLPGVANVSVGFRLSRGQ